jgi:hypothetical protein
MTRSVSCNPGTYLVAFFPLLLRACQIEILALLVVSTILFVLVVAILLVVVVGVAVPIFVMGIRVQDILIMYQR